MCLFSHPCKPVHLSSIKSFFIKLVNLVRLSIHSSIHLSIIHPSTHLLIPPSIHVSNLPANHQPYTHPTNHMPIRQSNVNPLSSLSVYLTSSLPIRPSDHPFIGLSHFHAGSSIHPSIPLIEPSIFFTHPSIPLVVRSPYGYLLVTVEGSLGVPQPSI